MKNLMWATALMGLVACGDKDEPTDSGGDVTSADVQAIADTSCGEGCHTGGASSGDLALDDVNTSVGAASSVEGMSQVEAGSTDDSYLWHKLEGTHEDVGGTGSAMPLGPALSDEDATTIETWILEGAVE